MEQRISTPSNYSQIWAVSDGLAGNRRQAEALANALGQGAAREVHLQSRHPWRWLAPRRLPGSANAFGTDFSHAIAPSLAVGCGRQAALATRVLRERGSRVVQILDPRMSPRHWDYVVVPEHDALRGPNVIPMLGSLNPVDDAWLARARTEFAHLGHHTGPRTAVLIGGHSAHLRFDLAAFERLADQVENVLRQQGGSVLATSSRRTDADVVAALRQRSSAWPGVLWCDDNDGANPYAGLLAWADCIICTADSVNMISEACATRAPVFVFEPEQINGRPRQFLDSLLRRGRIRTMRSPLSHFSVEPLRETARVAALLRERLGLSCDATT